MEDNNNSKIKVSYRLQQLKDSLLLKRGKLFETTLKTWAFIGHDLFRNGGGNRPAVLFPSGESFILCTVTDYRDPEGQRVIDALGFSVSELSETLILKILVGSQIRYIRLGAAHDAVKDPCRIVEGFIVVYQEIEPE